MRLSPPISPYIKDEHLGASNSCVQPSTNSVICPVARVVPLGMGPALPCRVRSWPSFGVWEAVFCLQEGSLSSFSLPCICWLVIISVLCVCWLLVAPGPLSWLPCQIWLACYCRWVGFLCVLLPTSNLVCLWHYASDPVPALRLGGARSPSHRARWLCVVTRALAPFWLLAVFSVPALSFVW